MSNKKLRVLHYPSVPCKAFTFECGNSAIAARAVQNALALQHLWLLENDFIDDYANSIVVQQFDPEMNELSVDSEDAWIDFFHEVFDENGEFVDCLEWDQYCEQFVDTKINQQ